MPRPRSNVRWLVSGVTALLVLGALFTAAERRLWHGGGVLSAAVPKRQAERWLALLPPPPVVEAGDPPPLRAPRRQPPPWAEAPWWELGRQGRGTADLLHPATAAPDSSRLLLARLGLAADLAVRARPDSVLAARLIWLVRREGYLPAEVRPLLRALGRAEAYRVITSRAAEMYDEFLDQEIITPD